MEVDFTFLAYFTPLKNPDPFLTTNARHHDTVRSLGKSEEVVWFNITKVQLKVMEPI